jgi:hypothetical protein
MCVFACMYGRACVCVCTERARCWCVAAGHSHGRRDGCRAAVAADDAIRTLSGSAAGPAGRDRGERTSSSQRQWARAAARWAPPARPASPSSGCRSTRTGPAAAPRSTCTAHTHGCTRVSRCRHSPQGGRQTHAQQKRPTRRPPARKPWRRGSGALQQGVTQPSHCSDVPSQTAARARPARAAAREGGTTARGHASPNRKCRRCGCCRCTTPQRDW